MIQGQQGGGGVGKIRYAHVCGGGKKTKPKAIIIIVIKKQEVEEGKRAVHVTPGPVFVSQL